jgi:hypothetical protein
VGSTFCRHSDPRYSGRLLLRAPQRFVSSDLQGRCCGPSWRVCTIIFQVRGEANFFGRSDRDISVDRPVRTFSSLTRALEFLGSFPSSFSAHQHKLIFFSFRQLVLSTSTASFFVRPQSTETRGHCGFAGEYFPASSFHVRTHAAPFITCPGIHLGMARQISMSARCRYAHDFLRAGESMFSFFTFSFFFLFKLLESQPSMLRPATANSARALSAETYTTLNLPLCLDSG